MHAKFSLGLRSRITAFVAGISLVVVLIAFGTWNAWVRIHTLRLRLTAERLGSFDISDQFRQQFGDLNTELLSFAVHKDRSVWSEFKRKSLTLDHWIDDKFPELQSDTERDVVRQLDPIYDDYRRAADQVEAAINGGEQGSLIGALAEFERQKDRILTLGSRLAEIHQKSTQAFVGGANESLEHVMLALLFGLVLLLGCAGGLCWVIYRELIAPLRVQLIESRMLVERHEKLASLGMLAAGVAHEIRNPLTAIKARLYSLRRRLSNSQDRTDTDVIDSEINRLERIVKDFLLFARPSEPEFVVESAMQPLDEVKTLLGPHLERKGITLSVEDPVDAWVRVDPHQLKQVLINLIQNAADATQAGGKIKLRARCDHGRLGDVACDVVILEVSDSGAGISQEVQSRLFDPFFSTKESGTGLGLSIAARIVEKHGGALQFQTQVDEGTIFGVVLPQAPPPVKKEGSFPSVVANEDSSLPH